MDQFHLKRLIEQAKDVVRSSPYDVNEVNWQSVAVLLAHGDCYALNDFLCLPGWFKDGLSGRYSTSLYLSPKGMPFYVAYAGHDDLYHGFMNCQQHPLNRAGWLHISNGIVRPQTYLSREQKSWLAENKPGGWRAGWEIAGEDRAMRAVEPYAKADKFNVRPTVDEDRFYMRCLRQPQAQQHAAV